MDITRKLYMGIVEDNKDPNKKGRIKVRVQAVYNNLLLEDIPYASPFMDIAGKAFKVPAIGKIVNVLFLTNDLYDPYYIFSENYNINLENKLKDLDDSEYVDFVALLFDERTQISADSNELTIDHLYNKITINKESINHELKDNSQKLNLGDRGADQEAVLGTHFFDWMDDFMTELLKPTSLLGNQNAPINKPILDQLITRYQLLRHTFVSNHVKIVDNNEVTKLERSPSTNTSKEDISLINNELVNSTNTNTNENVNNLQQEIETQNKKSCQVENSSKPTSQLPQPETELHENVPDFVPEGGSYETRLINSGGTNMVMVITDDNRQDIDNYEKSQEANKILNSQTPDGTYKGQNYFVNGLSNQTTKVYNPQEIEDIKITKPPEIGKFDIYLNGVNKGSAPAVKIKNKIVIADYYDPLKKMIDAAKSDGVTIILNDAFRKYEEQYNLRVQNAPFSKKQNSTFLKTASSSKFTPVTGRPGYSRHTYGSAFDISTAGGKNAAYKWLEKNAINFGFVRTVKSETWHWEYKPWEISGIRQWDKYAVVPKDHYTWNSDSDDIQYTTTNQNENSNNNISDEC